MSLPARGLNRILSALDPEEYSRLMAGASEVPLEVGHVLYEANQPVSTIHFIESGIGSVVTTMADGTTIEVMVVGYEGIVGLAGLENESKPATRAFMQVAGHGIKVSSAVVRQEFSRAGKLQSLLLRYLQFTIAQISHTAACNRLHDLEERLARWLLMVHDRVRVDEFVLTHDFLSQMLGTRRSSVTLAAGTLQRAGLINYHRGRIQISNREGLESVACECYPNIKTSLDSFLAK
jgi:CRP-like cAMP-binding protein